MRATLEPMLSLPGFRPQGESPLYRQLYDYLREGILKGQLAPGTRLPPTRDLSRELGLSRNTVVSAFEQLLAEGYLEARVGDGTYVARTLPGQWEARPLEQGPGPNGRRLSRRGEELARTPVTLRRKRGSGAFRAGLPDFRAFPMKLWARLEARHWKLAPDELLNYSDPAGYYPLRESVAAYLQTSRGVVCTPEQVIITTGSQQGLDLAARLLLDPGDAVWVEDPGYLGARGAFLAAGARVVAVSVDREGLDVATGRRLEPRARLAYVTPSHQYPLGVTLSLRRRLELLEWASEQTAWIVEDDYDSEYRYRGRPLAALQGLDREGRVIYVGTFSKVMMPGLRLGYLVVPPDLIEAFAAGRALMDRHPPGPVQAVLAEFIREGHFVRHIKRTRLLYAERQQALLEALERHFGGWLEVHQADAGLHLAAWLPQGVDDQEASRLAAEQGIEVLPLSAYSLAKLPRGGLMLGYAAFTLAELEEGVVALREALTPLMRTIS